MRDFGGREMGSNSYIFELGDCKMELTSCMYSTLSHTAAEHKRLKESAACTSLTPSELERCLPDPTSNFNFLQLSKIHVTNLLHLS